MKRILRIVSCLVLAALLCCAGLSRLIYGRSLVATLYEFKLRRDFATDRTAESEIARLEARREAGEQPCILPKNMAFKSGIGESRRCGMQVFTLNPGGEATALYLHGGAYINPFNIYQWRFMDKLARSANCRVVAPAYHLAPFADYRQAYDDLYALYGELSAEGRPLVLMGDSAGGGLALGLAEYLAARGESLPARLILFSPWVDVSMDNPDIAHYVGVDPVLHLELVKVHGQYWSGGDTHRWMASPLYGDMAGLPPTDIYCGTRELLYPDILLARDRLEAAGVEVHLHVGSGLNHDYPLMPIPEAYPVLRQVADSVRRLG